MQSHLTPAEVVDYLSELGFSSASLLDSKESRNMARAAINKRCGSRWTNGRLLPDDGSGFSLWTLYTANKGHSFDIKIF